MNTLREIVAFVGLEAPTSTRAVGNRVPLLSREARTSMRAMILGLQNLPPISLEAEADDTVGEVPFAPSVHVHPSNGVILETRVAIFQNGRLFAEDDRNMGASGGFNAFLTLDIPGSYLLEVRRTGIPNTGITTLRKTFDINARPEPAPETTPPVKPFISVQSNGDGSFVVSGSNFLPNATVHIRVVDGPFGNEIFLTATSTPEGKLQGFPTGRICQNPGQLFFSANDGRSDPTDLTGTLFSNTVTTTCPF